MPVNTCVIIPNHVLVIFILNNENIDHNVLSNIGQGLAPLVSGYKLNNSGWLQMPLVCSL